jgi:hypothetical protein
MEGSRAAGANPPGMRNRLLHDALRDFALESAALLTDELRAGAELEFDVLDEGGKRGQTLYRYKPRIEAFISERWPSLRELPSFVRATEELGAGAALWLRVNGLRGEQAEPALQAMLLRLYEDATSFGFPEERFERVYGEVEATFYRDTVQVRVIAPLRGAALEADRIDLGGGLTLERGELSDAPPQAVWAEDGCDPAVLCVLERDAPAGDGISAVEAGERFAGVVTALRLWAPGYVTLGGPAWQRRDEGVWQPMPVGSGSIGVDAATWVLPKDEREAFQGFFASLSEADAPQAVAWALRRFEMGCERMRDDEALSDHLLAMRALLDAGGYLGPPGLARRIAALCAEEGAREELQGRIEAAIALERFVMVGGGLAPGPAQPRELVAEVETHLRALLRDVLCGYLDADLAAVADDILLESSPDPPGEITARDLRSEEPEREPEPEDESAAGPEPEPEAEPEPEPALEAEPEAALEAEPEPALEAEPEPALEAEPEPDTAELEAVAVQSPLEGVTASADWGTDDPEDYSAPV